VSIDDFQIHHNIAELFSQTFIFMFIQSYIKIFNKLTYLPRETVGPFAKNLNLSFDAQYFFKNNDIIISSHFFSNKPIVRLSYEAYVKLTPSTWNFYVIHCFLRVRRNLESLYSSIICGSMSFFNTIFWKSKISTFISTSNNLKYDLWTSIIKIVTSLW
jgi:hypothetical protein